MKKFSKYIGVLMVAVLTLALSLSVVTAESAPTTEAFNDFSGDKSLFVRTDSYGSGSTVTLADGSKYFSYSIKKEGVSSNNYADATLGAALSDLKYAVIDYDMAAEGEFPDGMRVFPILRDASDAVVFDAKRDLKLGADANGGVAYSADALKGLGEENSWHHYTWVIGYVGGEEATASNALYVDGELLFVDTDLPADGAVLLSAIRFDIPKGYVTPGEGFRVDNLRVRTYGNDYEGGISSLLSENGDLTSWAGNVFLPDYEMPTVGCEASVNGIFYATVEQALSSLDDGDELCLFTDNYEPFRIEKAVTAKSENPLRYYSSGYACDVSEGVYTFRAADTSELAYVDWYPDGENAERLTYAAGSYPVYYGTSSMGDVVNGTECSIVRALVDADGNEITELLPLTAGQTVTVKADRETVTAQFEIVDELGNVEVFYDPTVIGAEFKYMPSGSTLRLLTDITGRDFTISFGFLTAGTYSFDFNGYTLKCEKKTNIFTVNVDNVVFNVYSSRPGARLFGKSNQTELGVGEGSNFINASGKNSVVNLGAYGEYPGSNLSTYTPAVVDITGGAGTVTVNVRGGSYYRNLTDWSGFFIARAGAGASVLNIDGARLIGTLGVPNFNIVANGFTANVTNSTVMCIDGVSGNLCSNLGLNSSVIFDNCIFGNMVFAASTHPAPAADSEDVEGTIVINDTCSFMSKLLKSPLSYLKLPVGGQVRVNRPIEGEIVYNVYGSNLANLNYDMITYEGNARGIYVYTTSEEVSDIEWVYLDDYISETWLNGELPYPPFEIPEDSATTKYVMDKIEPVTDYAMYALTPSINFTVLFSITAKENAFDLNLYVPTTAVDLQLVSFSGTSFNMEADALAAYPKATLDGVEYYKLSKKDVSYTFANNSHKATFYANGNDIKATEYSTILGVSVPDYVGVILGGSYTADEKQVVKDFLQVVKTSFDAIGATVPEELKKYLDQQ